jgi:hypothetical protein
MRPTLRCPVNISHEGRKIDTIFSNLADANSSCPSRTCSSGTRAAPNKFISLVMPQLLAAQKLIWQRIADPRR